MTLRGSGRPLTELYDAALLDLDGVVYVGGQPVPHAADAVTAARASGMRVAFVTNNASRLPADVASRLTSLGVDATPDDVVTSAQAAAHLLAARLPRGAPVLVTGAPALRDIVAAAGLQAVASADDRPVAVVQGYASDIRYADLAEATLAVRAGAMWVATNADSTMPSPRGLLPGNGAMVSAVATATGRQPEVAGKPQLPLHQEAIRRTGAQRPLVVGDRLDTDIEGAVAAGTPSLLVLTGVTSASELLGAPPHARPTYLAGDLRGLVAAHPEVAGDENGVRCGGWVAVTGRDSVDVRPLGTAGQEAAQQETALYGATPHGAGRQPAGVQPAPDVAPVSTGLQGAGSQDLDWLRAAAVACWQAADRGAGVHEIRLARPAQPQTTLAVRPAR